MITILDTIGGTKISCFHLLKLFQRLFHLDSVVEKCFLATQGIDSGKHVAFHVPNQIYAHIEPEPGCF